MLSIYNFFYSTNSITGQRELWYLPNSLGMVYGKMKHREYCVRSGALSVDAVDLMAMQADVDAVVNTLALYAPRSRYAPFDYEATVIDTRELICESYPGGKIIMSHSFIQSLLCPQGTTKEDQGVTAP